METCGKILAEVKKIFAGNDEVVRKMLLTFLAGGHVLLEDIPGVGKTTLAVAFSKAMNFKTNRIQFTPDVMPSDVTGFTLYNQNTHEMVFQPGAVMTNFLLADEINRASSRSQSALLQAMEENLVTVDNITHDLPNPFFVIATQNPFGSAGTQLLPESQTDRFMTCLSIGYPEAEAELLMLQRKHGASESQEVQQVADLNEIMLIKKNVAEVYIHEEIYKYILRLIQKTRDFDGIQQGASPRASVAFAAMSQAGAYMSGRDYVIPADVKNIYPDCIAHRIVLSAETARSGKTAKELLKQILRETEEPKLRKGTDRKSVV